MATLNVDPGAYRPTVAVDSPPPPGPLAAASTSPDDGRIATIALAGATALQGRLGEVLQARVERRLQRRALHRLRAEQVALGAAGAAGRPDGRAPASPQQLVVPLLKPGQPGEVPGGDGAPRRLDDLRGRLAHRPQHRPREPAARCERQHVGDHVDPGHRADRLDVDARRVLLADDDRLDERPLAGGRDPARVGLGVDAGERRERAGRGVLAGGVGDARLVDAQPQHRPVDDDRGAALAEHRAAQRRGALDGERLPLDHPGRDELGRPADAPLGLVVALGVDPLQRRARRCRSSRCRPRRRPRRRRGPRSRRRRPPRRSARRPPRRGAATGQARRRRP